MATNSGGRSIPAMALSDFDTFRLFLDTALGIVSLLNGIITFIMGLLGLTSG